MPNLPRAPRVTEVFSGPEIAALLASANGASYISFLQGGSGAVARTVESKLRDAIDVRDFGAECDGVTDDYASVAAAVAAAQARGAGTTVLFPAGTVCMGTRLTVEDTPVFLQGAGQGMGAYDSFPATVGTTLKFTGSGGATDPFIHFKGCQSRGGMRGFSLNANGATGVGLSVDTVLFGVFEELNIYSPTKKALLLTSNIANGSTCSWNRFANVLLHAPILVSTCALHVTGDAATNSCHNTFENLAINYGAGSAPGADGIWLGNCDNNRFYGTYMGRANGAHGVGVRLISNEVSPFPHGNIFVHLQAGDGGWLQGAGQTRPNTIIGYQRFNGEPAPATSDTPLLWFDEYGRWNMVMGGSAGDAGTGDPRTVFNVAAHGGHTFAQIICGFQGSGVNFFDGAVHHFRNSAQSIDVTIQDDRISGAIPVLNTYTVGALPNAATNVRGMIYVSNETGGAVPAFSDGTNWRRVTDRAIVS